ncbi:MAG: hypothetical protein AMXMBFR66_12630 [Pseudomonadota bacterium]
MVGAPEPRTIEALRRPEIAVPDSAEIAIEQRLVTGAKQPRHEASRNALTAAERGALPTVLERPSAVYFDPHNGHIVFVSDGLGPVNAAIALAGGGAGECDRIVAALRVSDVDIAGAVKGGRWILVR